MLAATTTKNPATTLPAKKCVDCGEMKPLEDFRRNNQAQDRRRTECKRCSLAREKKENVLPTYGKPVLYTRDCNRCDRRYTGRGRLLCDSCLQYANKAGDNDVGGNGAYRRGTVPT